MIITEAAANHGAFWPRSLSVTTRGEMETTDTDGVVLNHTCVNKHTTPAKALISRKTCDQIRLCTKEMIEKRRLKPLLFGNELLGAHKEERE